MSYIYAFKLKEFILLISVRNEKGIIMSDNRNHITESINKRFVN